MLLAQQMICRGAGTAKNWPTKRDRREHGGPCCGVDCEFLQHLGVDEPIDYEKTQFEDIVHDVDAVLDPIGGDTQKRSWKTLRKGGILVSIVGPPSTEEAKNPATG